MRRNYDEMSDPGSSRQSTFATGPENVKIKAAAMREEIREDVRYSVFCDTPGFLESIFNVDQNLIDDVYKACIGRKGKLYFVTKKSWPMFPTSRQKTEKRLFDPFVKLLRAITDKIPEGTRRNDVGWHSCHSRTPVAYDPKAADIRPDIVATLGQPDSEDTARSVPWHRIVLPVEVKKDSYEGPALLQLLSYQRQIFHECVDRRFVLGIVLTFRTVYVYLADRSGVLGGKAFDLHDDPKSLIRIAIGVATMDVERLGWDTTMTALELKEMYTEADLEEPRRYSFEMPFDGESKAHYWIVKMPKPVAGEYGIMHEDEFEEFVLYKPLSLMRGEVIRGRATRVWKAWRLDDMTRPQKSRQVFILKDTWRDDRRLLEGEYYKQMGGPLDGVVEMHSYGVVSINGQQDTTDGLIRCGLKVEGNPRCVDAKQTDIVIPNVLPDRERQATVRHVLAYDYLPQLAEQHAHRGRTHSRLVMKTYGWSIKYAKDLLELVAATRDAIAGHRNSHEKGVLHRDISIENILITGSNVKGRRGVLIDFDNAKDHKTLVDDPASGTRPFMSAELLEAQKYFVGAAALHAVRARQHRPQEDSAPEHGAFHDLESIMWVFIWYALSTEAPAMHRRELYDVITGDVRLRQAFVSLFEGDIAHLAAKKRCYMESPVAFGTVFCLISEYCDPLQSLILRLFDILSQAFKIRIFGQLYPQFIQAFDDMEETLRKDWKMTDDYHLECMRNEGKRRQKDEKDWAPTPRKKAQQRAMDEDSSTSDADEGDEPSSPTPAAKRRKTAPSGNGASVPAQGESSRNLRSRRAANSESKSTKDHEQARPKGAGRSAIRGAAPSGGERSKRSRTTKRS